jgi:hypothetical protein
VVAILDKDSFVGHAGVIDRDFGDLLAERIENENLLIADENDFELMIFRSDVFERFVAEYCSPDKVRALENDKKLTLREILGRSATVIGALRYLSASHGWTLNFDDMEVRFMSRHDIDIDVGRQIEHLRGRSHGTTMPSVGAVKQAIEETMRQHSGAFTLVCGHDLCEIVSKGVHDIFGRAHVKLTRTGIAVEEVFRAAYSRDDFESSSLIQQIRAWEAKRRPFRILHP